MVRALRLRHQWVQGTEQWEISADAKTGRYVGLPGADPQDRTEIDLRGGRVTVRQIDPGGRAEASTTAPDNYIPEGLMTLAVRRVAARGTRAAFKMIVNSEAMENGRVRFADVAMTPGKGEKGQRVRVTTTGKAFTESKTYEVDAQGRIWKIAGGRFGITYTLVRTAG